MRGLWYARLKTWRIQQKKKRRFIVRHSWILVNWNSSLMPPRVFPKNAELDSLIKTDGLIIYLESAGAGAAVRVPGHRPRSSAPARRVTGKPAREKPGLSPWPSSSCLVSRSNHAPQPRHTSTPLPPFPSSSHHFIVCTPISVDFTLGWWFTFLKNNDHSEFNAAPLYALCDEEENQNKTKIKTKNKTCFLASTHEGHNIILDMYTRSAESNSQSRRSRRPTEHWKRARDRPPRGLTRPP